jgi:serine phosphatase RsbU (regulator of sigma subunit)
VPHVQLILDHNIEPPAPLRTALNRVHAQVSIRSLDRALAEGVSATADLCVILHGSDRGTDVLDAVLARASDRACGTMLIAADELTKEYETATGSLTARGTLSGHRLIPFGRSTAAPLNADELTGRIKALCEIRHPMRRMRDELDLLRSNREGQWPQCHDFDEQIRLAGQIQNDLLPEPITDTGPLSISTLYLPADFVSGDTYDINRLDEDRFGFSLADATGHGLPAALLAILVKNSLRGKEIYDGSYRIVEPDELLRRINDELLTSNLRQCHFITALHAIFDRTINEIRWARGGVPYPLFFREGEPPRQIRSAGSLIGAFGNQTYEVARIGMRPGDVLLFHTDGLEALLLGRDACQGDDALLNTEWVRGLTQVGPEDALDQIRRLAAKRDPAEWSRDDITAIALRMS